jgi:hypothetical protein
MVDGGVIASRFEEEAVSRRRIWDRSVDESRGRVATVCVDILRIDLGPSEKNDRVGCAQRVLCFEVTDRTEVHGLMWCGSCCCFVPRKLGGVPGPGRQFPPQHSTAPANLITTSLFLVHVCLGYLAVMNLGSFKFQTIQGHQPCEKKAEELYWYCQI